MHSQKIYKSKISYWLLSILLVVFGSVLILLLSENKTWYFILLFLALFAFIIQIFVSTRYIIDGSLLKIRSGIFYKLDLDIQLIRKVESSNSPLSSPAASFDRLEIFYNKFDSVLISPERKEEFVNDLKSINNSIEIRIQS
jgi:hypothetical protein